MLSEFSQRFLEWLGNVTLEDKTKTYYQDGWRLLQTTTIGGCDWTRSRGTLPKC